MSLYKLPLALLYSALFLYFLCLLINRKTLTTLTPQQNNTGFRGGAEMNTGGRHTTFSGGVLNNHHGLTGV